MSLLWYERGTPILVDSGKYSYDIDDWRSYAKSSRAHNTVEIDGGDYTTSRRHAYGSALKSFTPTDHGYLVSANVHHRRSGVDRKRVVVVKPKHFLLVIDVLNGASKHEYRQWFHFHEALSLARTKEGVEITGPDGELVARGVFIGDGESRLNLVKGQKEPQIQGWISRKYKQIVPNYALSNESEGVDVVLAAAFSLSDQGAPRISATDAGVYELCYGTRDGIRVDFFNESVAHVPCEQNER